MIGFVTYNYKSIAIWWRIFRMASHLNGPTELVTVRQNSSPTHEIVDVGLD